MQSNYLKPNKQALIIHTPKINKAFYENTCVKDKNPSKMNEHASSFTTID